MSLSPLSRWRNPLLFMHRWLGILLGLLLLLWAASGVVLMYAGPPQFPAGERLARLQPLDLSTARVEPAAALASVPGVPRRLRIAMYDSRPVYRLNTGEGFGSWTLVFADTGEHVLRLSQDDLMFALVKLYPEFDETLSYERHLFEPDQFSHLPALQNHFPLHRINMGNGDEYYVSERSGEIVMRTTRLGRVLGFFGYNLHTLGFWRQQAWWRPLLQGAGWLSFVMTLAGLAAGVQRGAEPPAAVDSATRQWWRWHRLTGLTFGAVTLTWLLSGLVALDAVPGLGTTNGTAVQQPTSARSARDEDAALPLELLTLDALREAVGKIGAEFPVKELELQIVNGEPYYLAYRPPAAAELAGWRSRGALDFLAPALDAEHRYISATNVVARPFEEFAEPELLQLASRAMPGLTPVRQQWLRQHDAYYYHGLDSFAANLPLPVKTLPVLRLEYADAAGTWLYLSPSHAQVLKIDGSDRRRRWWLQGLHGFDVPWLYENRPLWDILLLLLLCGTLALGFTAVYPAWQRLKHLHQRLLDLLGGQS